MKVLIADDEALERDVYRIMLQRHFPQAELVAEAETGRQAIELHARHAPDLMLMDVKMPGINGVEAIAEIRRHSESTRFIIISAYNFFDYAKLAMQHGVEDYLLKPVSQDDFVRVVGRAARRIEEDRESRMQTLEMRERLKSLLPLLESDIAMAVALGDQERIRTYAPLFGTDLRQGTVVVGLMRSGDEEPVDSIARSLALRRIQDYVSDNMPELRPCLQSGFMSGKLLLVFPNDGGMACREAVFRKVLHLQQVIRTQFACRMSFGIGAPYGTLAEMCRSYGEALAVVHSTDAFGMDIVSFSDVGDRLHPVYQYPFEQERRLLEKVRLGLTEPAMTLYLEIWDHMNSHIVGKPERVRFALLELHFSLGRLRFDLEDAGAVPPADVHVSRPLPPDDPAGMFRVMEEEIRWLCGRFGEERTRRAKGALHAAMECIRSRYREDLTLEEVARTVNVSPNYFSRMFRNEVGQSFIDFLTGTRVEAAKKLIGKPGMSIGDICWEVGYNDPNYFAKVFRKATGISPSEYRERQALG